MSKSIYHLKVKVFGNKHLKLSSFIQLKRTIVQMKITLCHGVKAWNKRFVTFQDYLPRCLWVVGKKCGEWSTTYDEERKCEILEFALSAIYFTLLSNIGWCLQENSYRVYITTLNKIESGIKLKIENQKKIDASVRATSNKDNKALKKTPCACGDGGNSNRKYYWDYETCRKRHPDKCCLLSSGGGSRGDCKNTATNILMISLLVTS